NECEEHHAAGADANRAGFYGRALSAGEHRPADDINGPERAQRDIEKDAVPASEEALWRKQNVGEDREWPTEEKGESQLFAQNRVVDQEAAHLLLKVRTLPASSSCRKLVSHCTQSDCDIARFARQLVARYAWTAAATFVSK